MTQSFDTGVGIDVGDILTAGSPNTDRARNIIPGGAAGRHANGEAIEHGDELPHLEPRFGQEDEPKSHIGGHMEFDLTSNLGDDKDV